MGRHSVEWRPRTKHLQSCPYWNQILFVETIRWAIIKYHYGPFTKCESWQMRQKVGRPIWAEENQKRLTQGKELVKRLNQHGQWYTSTIIELKNGIFSSEKLEAETEDGLEWYRGRSTCSTRAPCCSKHPFFIVLFFIQFMRCKQRFLFYSFHYFTPISLYVIPTWHR